MARLSLEEIAEMARKHEITAAERRAQRVSLIMGLGSKDPTLTREKVERLVDETEGHFSPSLAGGVACGPTHTD